MSKNFREDLDFPMTACHSRLMKRAISVICIVLLSALVAPVAVADGNWAPLQALSTSGKSSRGVMAASQNGLIATAFWWTGTSARAGITYSSTTRDGGATWSARKSMLILPTESTVVMSDSGQRIIGLMGTWNNRIYSQYSADAGATWTLARNSVATDYWTTTDEFESGRIGADVSADGLTVVAAWTKESGNPTKPVMVAKSADGGATWSAPKQVSAAGSSGYFPQVAVSADGSNVTIAYDNYAGNVASVAISRSNDGGATWSAPSALSFANQAASDAQLSMSDNGSVGWTLWENIVANDGVEIWGNRTLDGGVTWSPARQLSTAGSVATMPRVKVAGDGSRSIASWLEHSANNVESFVTTTQTTEANAWTALTPVNAGFPVGAVQRQHFAASSDAYIAAITWASPTGGATRSVLTTLTSDGGSTWSVPETTANAPALQSGSSVVTSADGTRLFITETGQDVADDATRLLYASVKMVARADSGGSHANGGQAAAHLQAQVLTPSVSLPVALKRHGWSRIARVPISTNAGQAATVSALAVVTKTGAPAKARDFRTKVVSNGKAKVFKVRLSGRRALSVTIAITAPETAVYNDFAIAKTYTMKKAKRWN